jgi:hypothetical protein
MNSKNYKAPIYGVIVPFVSRNFKYSLSISIPFELSPLYTLSLNILYLKFHADAKQEETVKQ